jgi:hypothetical protein
MNSTYTRCYTQVILIFNCIMDSFYTRYNYFPAMTVLLESCILCCYAHTGMWYGSSNRRGCIRRNLPFAFSEILFGYLENTNQSSLTRSEDGISNVPILIDARKLQYQLLLTACILESLENNAENWFVDYMRSLIGQWVLRWIIITVGRAIKIQYKTHWFPLIAYEAR